MKPSAPLPTPGHLTAGPLAQSPGFLACAGLAISVALAPSLGLAQSNYSDAAAFTTLVGAPGTSGSADGPVNTARFSTPIGVAVAPSGLLYVADYNNSAVRRVGVDGAVSTLRSDPGYFFNGVLYNRLGANGVALDESGNVNVASFTSHSIVRISSSGAIVTRLAGARIVDFSTGLPISLAVPSSLDGSSLSSGFRNPTDVTVDSAGTVYVSDEGNNLVRKVTPSGVISTLAGSAGLAGSADGTGSAARFNRPRGIGVDQDFNVYVADFGSHTIRKITPGGTVTTLAGLAGTPGSQDGVGTGSRFNLPHGLSLDSAGNIYVADFGNHTIRRIALNGDVTTLGGSAGNPGSVEGTGAAARFNGPRDVVVHSDGTLYVADGGNHTIRRGVMRARFSVQPVSQSVFAGAPATFTATATGAASISYAWQKDGAAIPGATAATLTLANVQSANLGSYVLVATTAAGSTTSNPATLSFSAAPSFTTQPASQTAAVGATATFTAVATGAGTILYQWLKDGGALPGATTNTLTIANVQAANLGTYTVIASNTSGPTVSNPATLSFTLPPSFTTHPTSQAVAPGATATFAASVTGTGLITYQWLKDGVSIPSATTPSLTVVNVQAANLGTYLLIASNAGGPATSNPAILSFPTRPTFQNHPADASVLPGATTTFSATAISGLPVTYQWLKDGIAIPNATTATLTVTNVQLSNLGAYTVVATNSVGPATSNPATLSFALSTAGRLTNLSIRTNAGTGAQTLIVGFVVGGADTSGPKPLLIRGAGPALGGFGLTGFLADPTLSVFSGANTVIASNDNWSGDAQVAAIGGQVGAFAFTVASSRDAALYSPALTAGAYTAQISGVGGTTGITLAEIYDATSPNNFLVTTPRLINVSARTQVGTGADILITGFNVGGATPRTLLIRAVGPTLATFGVTGVLADPRLELFSGTTPIQANDNWGGVPAIVAAAGSVGAFALDAASRDAVLLVTLAPGSYTAQVSGVGNTTGVALVEIYDVP